MEEEDVEKALTLLGANKLDSVKMKGVFVSTLVQTLPGPGYVVGSPVRTVLADVSLHVPVG